MLQVEKASYVWLPLLPRLDGRGYELVYAEKWSPSDYHQRARIPVSYNNGTTAEGVAVGPSMPSAQGLSNSGGSIVEPAGAAAEVRGAFLVRHRCTLTDKVWCKGEGQRRMETTTFWREPWSRRDDESCCAGDAKQAPCRVASICQQAQHDRSGEAHDADARQQHQRRRQRQRCARSPAERGIRRRQRGADLQHRDHGAQDR